MDTRITLNWVDVKDVAEGCFLAAEKGRPGERYILANEQCMTITDTTVLAGQTISGTSVKEACCRSKIYVIHSCRDYAILGKT